jgi:hypothetical protein
MLKWITNKRLLIAPLPVRSVIGSALFHEPCVSDGPCSSSSGVVLVRDIDFASTSEATLLPFHGRCHVAYLPAGGVVLGLSKLARIAGCYSKRLQSPRRLAEEIAAAFQQHVPCRGVAVVLQSRQLSPGLHLPAMQTTTALSGAFVQPGSPELEVRGESPLLPSCQMAPWHSVHATLHAWAHTSGMTPL